MESFIALLPSTVSNYIFSDGKNLTTLGFSMTSFSVIIAVIFFAVSPLAAMTIRVGIERILKEKAPEVNEVVAVD